jgi:hypothetical protein
MGNTFVPPLHPLLNPNSPHYDAGEDGKVAIEELEKEMTIQEMIGAMKYNIFKVNWRFGRKDPTDLERSKLKTYRDYMQELSYLIAIDIDPRISVNRGWDLAKKRWLYRP